MHKLGEFIEAVQRGETVVASMRSGHDRLWRWALDNGVAVRIDRKTRWGNPFIVGRDGERGECCTLFAEWFPTSSLNNEYALLQLKGKVLGCWCKPERCHGDHLAAVVNAIPHDRVWVPLSDGVRMKNLATNEIRSIA